MVRSRPRLGLRHLGPVVGICGAPRSGGADLAFAQPAVRTGALPSHVWLAQRQHGMAGPAAVGRPARSAAVPLSPTAKPWVLARPSPRRSCTGRGVVLFQRFGAESALPTPQRRASGARSPCARGVRVCASFQPAEPHRLPRPALGRAAVRRPGLPTAARPHFTAAPTDPKLESPKPKAPGLQPPSAARAVAQPLAPSPTVHRSSRSGRGFQRRGAGRSVGPTAPRSVEPRRQHTPLV